MRDRPNPQWPIRCSSLIDRALTPLATLGTALLLVALSAATSIALAVPLDVRDGDTALARISARDQTRVRVDRARILDVMGDIYDATRNPDGRLSLLKDDADGEVYIKPVVQTLGPGGQPLSTPVNLAPIKLDIKTDRGTFAVLLQPTDVPGDTLVLRPVGNSPVRPSVEAAQRAKAPAYLRSIKALTLVMANPDLASNDVQIQLIAAGGRELYLWREARFVLKATYTTAGMVGESYELTNISAQHMVIDERELLGARVESVAVKHLVLEPGASTPVWIIRQAVDPL